MRAKAKFRLGTLGALLLLSDAAAAAPYPGGSATPGIDSAFRATYPLTAPSANMLIAGVQLAKLVIPGLQITAQSEQAPADGGVLLSFADAQHVVRVLVHVAVSADAATARKVLGAELHGVASQLAKASDPTLGDLAWADDSGKGSALVIATQANVAYSVAVVGAAPPGVTTAAAIASLVRQAMVVGPPIFPAARVMMASTIDVKLGGAVRITVPAGCSYKVHAEGGYLARRQGGPIVRPLGPGPVTVYATAVDGLARVTVAAATTVAK